MKMLQNSLHYLHENLRINFLSLTFQGLLEDKAVFDLKKNFAFLI